MWAGGGGCLVETELMSDETFLCVCLKCKVTDCWYYSFVVVVVLFVFCFVFSSGPPPVPSVCPNRYTGLADFRTGHYSATSDKVVVAARFVTMARFVTKVCVCVRACVRVCVRQRERETEKEREKVREKEREKVRDIYI